MRQGHYALDEKATAAYRPADISVERIGALAEYSLEQFFVTAVQDR